MHVENGMILLLDRASKRNSIARLASIPHGDSVLAIGDWGRAGDPLIFPPIWSLPSDQDPRRLRAFDDAKTAEFDPRNPQATLEREIAGQHVLHATFINVATSGGGGILNTPFINREAKAAQFAGNFWIESVKDPTNKDHSFQQLQYVQTTVIEFRDKPKAALGRWPHVNLNTLVKQ
jgi:hypothetical protein